MTSTTTAGAAATLAMQAKFVQILCSAPTHVAVDDFANSLDQITRSIAEEYNKGKKADDASLALHELQKEYDNTPSLSNLRDVSVWHLAGHIMPMNIVVYWKHELCRI